MTDSTPMTPKEAQDYLKNASILGIAHHERRALETIANMTVEDGYRIVPAVSNGGIYQTRRWTRHVTEWKPDE